MNTPVFQYVLGNGSPGKDQPLYVEVLKCHNVTIVSYVGKKLNPFGRGYQSLIDQSISWGNNDK